LVLARSRGEECERIIDAINEEAGRHKVSGASVIVALAQVLAQNITDATPDIAQEVRSGIMGLIDDYAIRLAMTDDRT
jgi:hypothetical protein